MRKLKTTGLFLVGAACISVAYWLALTFFSFQTLVIQNDSDAAIAITVYDLSWTVEADGRVVKHFRSDKGDAHFTILNWDTQDKVGDAAYLTSGMTQCHTITVNDQSDYDVDIESSSLCHLKHW